jgi:hypothetical protein
VVHGAALVTVNETTKIVHENESIYIPIGAVHRMENPGKIPLELIEVQTGSYLGEDDLSPIFHPAIGRALGSFEPVWLGDATGRGAEPST